MAKRQRPPSGAGASKRHKQEGKPQRAARKPHQQRPVHVPDPEAEDSDEDAVNEEDLDFVRHLGAPAAAFLSALDAEKAPKPGQLPAKAPAAPKAQRAQADSDGEGDADEAAYERLQRARLPDEPKDSVQRLPIKGPDGGLVFESRAAARARIPAAVTSIDGVTVDEGAGAEEDLQSDSAPESDLEEAAGLAQDSPSAEDAADVPDGEGSDSDVSDLQEFQNAEERREELKQQIAVACNQLLQAPEEHLRNLRALLALTVDNDSEVVRLAMLSLLAVFKDILPGYRIRLPTEKELAMPVSKDVKRTRDYEASLLRLYQAYIKQITSAAVKVDSGQPSTAQVAQVAMHCMHGLLTSRPDFNCSSDLLRAVVPTMTNRNPIIAAAACRAMQRLLVADQQGDVTLEAVQLVADLIRKRDCRCNPQVLTCLFGVEVRDAVLPDFDKTSGLRRHKKKKRKKDKGVLAEVQNTFREADAVADFNAQKEQRSLVLEALFEILFRVLKQACGAAPAAETAQDEGAGGGSSSSSNSVRGKEPPLLGAALEGVRRFGHFISVDYFADLQAVLLRLLRSRRLSLLLRMQCLQTGVSVSRLQQDSLVDQHSFLDELCAIMEAVPLAPLLPGAAAGDEDDAIAARTAAAAEARSQTCVLLARMAQDMLCGTRLLDAKRVATAVKQLALTALAVDSGGAMGLLTVAARLLQRHAKLYTMLEHEPGAPPVVPALQSLQPLFKASASAGVLWELTALVRHYHPHVAQKAKSAAARAGGDATVDAASVVAAYSVGQGNFKPTPAQPAAKHTTSCGAAQRSSPAMLPGFAQATGSADTAVAATADRQLVPGLKAFRKQRPRHHELMQLQREQRLLQLQLLEFRQHLESL